MTGAVEVQPTSLVIDAEPGQAGSGSVTLTNPPADSAVTAAIAEGGDGFTVQSIAVTVQVWHRYTELEIDELPPSMRAAARKAGGYWQPQTTTGDAAAPVAVPAKAQVVVTVSATLPSVGVTTTTLTLTGNAWGTVEVPVFAVVGTATAAPVASVNLLGLICLPGDTATPTVTIQAPPAATVMATLASDTTGIAISQVTVRIPERHDWTPDELLDLPEDLREEAKKEGWIDWHNGPQGAAETPLVAPPNSIIAIDLVITVPASEAPDWLTGTLVLLSTTWQTVEIPVNIAISDFSAVPLTDRVSVQQGIPSDPVGVVLSSKLGPDTDVQFSIAATDAGDVTLDVPGTHLARNSSANQPLRVNVAPNAALGHYPIYLGKSVDVGLRVTAFGGIYDHRFPLGLTLLPGSVTVAALQGSIEGLQNSTVTCQISVNVSGGLKQLTVNAGALPNGVTMATVTQVLTGPVTTTLTLPFVVAPDAPTGEVMITIGWNAGDGVNSGALSLPFTVQLRPDSATFGAQVATETALGGTVAVELDNSGNGTFSGTMKAGGIPSFSFTVKSVIRSADGQIAIASQKSGEVYGDDTPFKSSEMSWSEPVTSALAASQWPAVRTATMTTHCDWRLIGTLGTVEDIVVDWLEFLATSALVSATGGVSAVIFVGEELANITGVRPLGPGGFAGVIVAGAATALLGPGILLPVLVGGVLVADVLIQSRRLNAAEIALASQVFGNTVPFDRVLLTNLKGLNGVEFTVPGADTDILVNFGDGLADAIAHVAPDRGYTQPGQILIHELTHAWQIANAGDATQYYWRAAMAKLAGNSSYVYGPAGPPWNKFGLEQQATIVEEWAVGTEGRSAVGEIPGRDAVPPVGMQTNDQYFEYIDKNIRLGMA